MLKRWRIGVWTGLVSIFVGMFAFTAHLVSSTQLSGTVKIDGSSTVFLITEAVAEEFQRRNPGVKPTIGTSGTGGGFKKFARGETDINNASRPIKGTEEEECRKNKISYIELPIAYDAIAVVVNSRNNWVDYLTIDELKRIWEPSAQGKVTNWSQVRKGFPNRPLRLLGPGTDSGTFDFFTEAVCGKTGASRGDYIVSEDDNILVQGVATDVNALGYFGYAYYVTNRKRLKAVPISHPDYNNGKPTVPSERTVIKNQYALSRPLFIYVNRKSADRPEVSAFVEFYLKNAAKLAKEVGYIPLSKRIYELAMERFKKRITGSIFGVEGAQVGISIQKLLEAKRSP